jgi:hypothetical protein
MAPSISLSSKHSPACARRSLERTQPGLPLKQGALRTRTYDYSTEITELNFRSGPWIPSVYALEDPRQRTNAKVAVSKLRMRILIAGLGLFVAALFFPGIIFKPDARSNPKHSECAFAVQDNVMCESFSFGGPGLTSCEVVEGKTSGKTFVDKGKILDYCKGWDSPVAASYYGYRILLMGFLGVLVGQFAWFANPLMLLALLLSTFKKRLASMILSVSSIALGLQSYVLEAVPFNESSMDSDNLNFVDHLGRGFYLWMGSLVTFSVYCLLRKEDDAARR